MWGRCRVDVGFSLEKAKEAKIRPIRTNSNVMALFWPLWPVRERTIERRRRRENNQNEVVEEGKQ